MWAVLVTTLLCVTVVRTSIFPGDRLHQLRQLDEEQRTDEQDPCALCHQFVGYALYWHGEGMPMPELLERLTQLCVRTGQFTEQVCRGSIQMNSEIVRWIIDAKAGSPQHLTPTDICGFALYPKCAMDESKFNWTLNLDFLGPKPTPETPELLLDCSMTVKVLQLTDVHIDPYYMPGYNAECGEPMCCHLSNGIPDDTSTAAGYWGDYRNCDVPLHSFQNMLAEAAFQHQDIAYVIFTGDIVNGATWATNQNDNMKLITLMQKELLIHFPNVPVISILGNHESHPTNVFADPRKTDIPESLRSMWLYTLAADLWSPWLPPETRPDILAGGMFAVEVQPGLVVLGINTMWCYSVNWWLMYDNVDPAGELIWLGNKLLEVEQAGKKAHILAHHPSGYPDCMHFWSLQYRRIIDRFENTVVAQFHGHTHNDQFSIYYDLTDPSRATNVAFTAGSGTPHVKINPNYRVYSLDPRSFRVLDHETWSYNLTEANLGGPLVLPNWQKLYSFNDAYGTTALFPEQMDALVHRMASDTDLQRQYFRFYVKGSDPELEKGCSDQCLHALMCDTVTTVTKDLDKCRDIFG